VADILKGLVGAGTSFVFAWVFPSAIALAVLYTLVVRRLGLDAVLGISALSPAEQALALGFAATVIGLVMNALSTPLYRVLEGYVWPARFRRWGVQREQMRRESIDGQVKARSGLERALAQERLQRFPRNDAQTAPTRLGNAIRAFETYGADRYQLDSQLLWIDLVAVAPDGLRKELDTARSSVDFFVAAIYLSLAVGIAAFVAALVAPSGPDVGVLVVGIGSLILAPVSYRSAVTSCSYWDATVRALVDIGRVPLAAALGLVLPSTIERERKMWNLVVSFAYYGFNERWAYRLDEFRVGASSASADVVDAGTSRSDPQQAPLVDASSTDLVQ
jgi:hypothetical protein